MSFSLQRMAQVPCCMVVDRKEAGLDDWFLTLSFCLLAQPPFHLSTSKLCVKNQQLNFEFLTPLRAQEQLLAYSVQRRKLDFDQVSDITVYCQQRQCHKWKMGTISWAWLHISVPGFAFQHPAFTTPSDESLILYPFKHRLASRGIALPL